MKSIGDTFIVPNPKNGKEHFYIVIGLAENGDPIAVNITSTRVDRSNCVIRPGEHPWITKDSGVNFWDIQRPMNLAALQEGVKQGVVRPQIPVSDALVRRIIEAARRSDQFPRRLAPYLSEV